MKLLKLYQPSCIPCEIVENYLQESNVEYESINVQERPEIAGLYGIMGTPVTILLDDNGNEMSRAVGFNSIELE